MSHQLLGSFLLGNLGSVDLIPLIVCGARLRITLLPHCFEFFSFVPIKKPFPSRSFCFYHNKFLDDSFMSFWILITIVLICEVVRQFNIIIHLL